MQLVRYDQARQALQLAHSVDEVKDIRDKAQAMAAYARQAKDTQLVEWATEIKVRAERRAGELLAALPRLNGKKGAAGILSTLERIDVPLVTAHRWQKLAAVPEEQFEQAVAAAKEIAGEVTTAAMLRLGEGGVRTQTSGDDEWYTPAKYVELARKVLDGIDLDPASNKFAQKVVKAGKYFTADDDGLTKAWQGSVWLNPPYSRGLMGGFVTKLRAEIAAGRTKCAILLTHNFTDTAWWHTALEKASAVCYTRGRIKFYNEHGEGDAPTSGHVFFYFGGQERRFQEAFRSVGSVTPARF